MHWWQAPRPARGIALYPSGAPAHCEGPVFCRHPQDRTTTATTDTPMWRNRLQSLFRKVNTAADGAVLNGGAQPPPGPPAPTDPPALDAQAPPEQSSTRSNSASPSPSAPDQGPREGAAVPAGAAVEVQDIDLDAQSPSLPHAASSGLGFGPASPGAGGSPRSVGAADSDATDSPMAWERAPHSPHPLIPAASAASPGPKAPDEQLPCVEPRSPSCLYPEPRVTKSEPNLRLHRQPPSRSQSLISSRRAPRIIVHNPRSMALPLLPCPSKQPTPATCR